MIYSLRFWEMLMRDHEVYSIACSRGARTSTHTHTHTFTNIYVYVYYICNRSWKWENLRLNAKWNSWSPCLPHFLRRNCFPHSRLKRGSAHRVCSRWLWHTLAYLFRRNPSVVAGAFRDPTHVSRSTFKALLLSLMLHPLSRMQNCHWALGIHTWPFIESIFSQIIYSRFIITRMCPKLSMFYFRQDSTSTFYELYVLKCFVRIFKIIFHLLS
jgi:hypothetical protein